MGRRQEWDVHTKRAVVLGLREILARLGVDIGDSPLIAQTVELLAGAHRADLVFMTADGVVIHIEIQYAPDPQMGLRLMEYGVRIVRTAPFVGVMTDLVQILVQVTGEVMPARYQLGRLSNEVLVLHVPSMSAAELLEIPGLAPFALESGGEGVVAAVVDRIAEVADFDTQVSLVTLALQSAPALGDRIVEQLRRMDMIDLEVALRETEFGRGLIAKGQREGRSQGLVEGQRAAVADFLAVRFPTAERSRVEATASRLVAEDPVHAARAAMVLTQLDT